MESEPPRRSVWTPLGLALLCAHCTLGAGLAALGALGLLGAPVLFGVNLHYVWPPAFILGAFALWLWSGRTRGEGAAACAAPGERE